MDYRQSIKWCRDLVVTNHPLGLTSQQTAEAVAIERALTALEPWYGSHERPVVFVQTWILDLAIRVRAPIPGVFTPKETVE